MKFIIINLCCARLELGVGFRLLGLAAVLEVSSYPRLVVLVGPIKLEVSRK